MSQSSGPGKEEGKCLKAPQGLARRLLQTLCGHTSAAPAAAPSSSASSRHRGVGAAESRSERSSSSQGLLSCLRGSGGDCGDLVGDCSGPAASALFEFLRTEWSDLEAHQPDARDRLFKLLDRLEPEDLGITRKEARRLRGRCSKVGYQDVYNGSELTLCIFVMAAGGRIPLHDHPDMHVFGRLLFGRMRVVSYDVEQQRPEEAREASTAAEGGFRPPHDARWARRRREVLLGPQPTTYSLGPEEGNIHELYALEDCAFFDIVLPPYDPAEGRNCTYYALARGSQRLREREEEEEVEEGASTDACAGGYWLAPTSAGDFTTEPLDYRGPRWPGEE